MTNVIVLDCETYYDRDYTLKKLTQEAYIRDRRFEALVLVAKTYRNGIPYSTGGPDAIADWVKSVDWADTVVICHHSAFDCGILSLRYGAIPKAIICTMSMARAVFGPGGPNFKGVSLEALAKHYGLAPKCVPYNKYIGYHWSGLSIELREELIAGCRQDVLLTEAIAIKLLAEFPKAELPIVDATVRMFTEPQFIGDATGFHEIAAAKWGSKNDSLDALSITEAQLQSASKFVKLLEECGQKVEHKTGKLGPIPAIAKSDLYMQGLTERDDRAGELARARLDAKSTLEETRAHQLAEAAERGPLPIYLSYCGAWTSRWSGGDGLNPQNLPRAGGLRHCFKAPEGMGLIIADFAQIEYRILCGLAGERDKLEMLASGKDVYKAFAVDLYRTPIEQVIPEQRRIAKLAVLGLGYGLGKERFWQVCESNRLDVTRKTTDAAVDLYRSSYSRVVNLWRELDCLPLRALADGTPMPIGPARIEGKAVVLPNGLRCSFCLRWDDYDAAWIRKTRNGVSSYWGGALTEFLCQSLARVCLSDIVLKVKYKLGLRPALLVHDELVYIVPAEAAEEYLAWLLQWMAETPHWWPDGPPMAAEGRVAETYGK